MLNTPFYGATPSSNVGVFANGSLKTMLTSEAMGLSRRHEKAQGNNMG